MAEKMRFKRVLLKVSGEALMGDGQYGIDVATVDRIADEVKQAIALGVEVCMVIGGGNIFVDWPVRLTAWTALPLIIWACWPQ